MMIKRLIASVALLTPAALAAQVVEPSQGRLEILGTSRPACVIGAAPSVAGNNMTFQPLSNVSGQVRITEFVDSNAVSRGGSIDVILPVICNSAHRIVVRSGRGGLRRVGAPVARPGPFAEFLPYQVNTAWGNQQAGLTTDQGTLIINAAEARAGQVALSIAVARGGRPLVAGTYEDQIVVELQAAD
jgi:hypothetical protein